MPVFLATKEMLRNKVRFVTIILIIAMITLLVIFLAALSDGLALSAKEYIENIEGWFKIRFTLLIYRQKSI
ncbi:hypothetical protein KFU94_09620 [Chloroflexi bacterium TSY]|nr:hypothetical protein [Chloroflexi bacterium TSY]